MHPLDIAIVVAYLLMMVAVGWFVAKLAARNPESYFLAGKSLPWWMIGIAHGSSGLDISGTMWFVMVLFVYGVKGVWLLWVWPLFNVIFRMVYLGTWVRRSNVLTGAEWMYTRFGRNTGTELAYLSMVVYALVSVVGFLSMAYIGIGKFTASFIPFETLGISAASLPGGMAPADFFAIAVMLIAGLYCVVGGMYSVVMNDLIQFALIVLASVIIGAIAIRAAAAQDVLAAVPDNWDRLLFGWRLDVDWSNLIPKLNEKLYNPITQGGDGYSIFGLFILMIFLKGILVSMAGPTPNYAIQHVLSTRSPREAALENLMMAIASLAPRFLLIAGIGTLGIIYFGPELEQMGAGGTVDFERILPNVVNRYLPIGAKGLILAGLLAAFMSTFVSTVNSGAAYVVNDIYKRYLDPHGPARRYVLLSYLCSVGIIALGIAFGFATKSVHSITEVLVSVIVPAFVIPNVIKWHWWRFNGYGFFAGMVAGTLSALVLLFIGKPEYMAHLHLAPIRLHPVYVNFPIIMVLATVASVGVCLLTRPEEDAVLKSFYRTVRPWGFWRPIYEKCRAEDPAIQPNRDFWRDWFNILVGIVWELAMVASPIFLVIQQYRKALLGLLIFLITSAILKYTWYNHLEPAEKPAGPVEIPAQKGILSATMLCLSVFLCCVGLFTFRQRRAFTFQGIVRQPSLTRFQRDFTAEIDDAKVFAEKYVRSYLEFLNKEIRPDLRSSFMLASKNCVSGKVFFSSVAESCIYLYPADESQLFVECTTYPVQFAVLTLLDTPGSTGRLTVPYEEAIREYEQTRGKFNVKKDVTFVNLMFSGSYPKVFAFSDDSLVTLMRIQFVLRDKEGRENKIELEHAAIMTGNSDFSSALKKAGDMGRELAQSEAVHLIVSSPFFREVLAYDKLRPVAEDILSKQSRAQKDADFQYPSPLAMRDIRDLQSRAAELGLDVSYIDSLLNDPSIGPDDGYLFWYYKNRTGFMLQWAFTNIVLLFAIVVLMGVKRWCVCTGWRAARSVAAFVKPSVLLAVVLGVNGYVFSQQPESLHVKYLAIPGFLLLVCLTLSLRATSKSKSGDKDGDCDLPSN